jgi:membrane protease YdiL (CAAX protease family)
LVLFVSFAHFVATSAYSLAGLTRSADPRLRQASLLSALIAEVGSLAVLLYVLWAQGRSWKDIGWNLERLDILRAVGLVLGSRFAGHVLWQSVQIFYHFYSGHYLGPKSTLGLRGLGVSWLSIALVCLNPVFEELIVRGYLMSEILDLGGNSVMAILISVAVQMSYHLYQGFARGIALTASFTVFSIYFWRTRRIAPVVVAHLWFDAYALFRSSF